MSARTLFPCAPLNPNAVAAAKESEDQSTHITDDNKDHGEIPQDSDLPSLDAALPSPPLMSTTEHQLESPTAEAAKDEGHEVKSESGSDVVMSPTWGVLLISPRSCGPADEEADAQQLWGDMTYGTRGHTYLADSSPDDDTAGPTFSWESFFVAMRDNTLPNVDIVAIAQ